MTIDMIKEFLYNEGNITVVDSVDAVDVKVGYCFVKCVDDGELDEKIHRVNGLCIPGFEDKKLTVEFTKTNLDEQKKREERKKAFVKPTDTLFVVGFDPTKVKPHYLEHEFESVAKVKRVELVKSFAYCYFYTIEDAIAVKEAFEDKELFGKKLHMEFKQYSRRDTRNEEVLPYDPRPIARDFYPPPIPVPTYRGRSRDREYRDPRDDRPILRLPPPPLYVRYDVPRRFFKLNHNQPYILIYLLFLSIHTDFNLLLKYLLYKSEFNLLTNLSTLYFNLL
uniref:RRM domain-containing protein n=1 Tax=Chromulina nebulosa TaxID=96789 RepID=A0A7S0SVG9_9STRA